MFVLTVLGSPLPPSTHYQIQIFVKMVKLLDALKHLLRSYKYFRKLIYLFIFVQKLVVFKQGTCGTLRSTCMYKDWLPVLSYQSCVWSIFKPPVILSPNAYKKVTPVHNVCGLLTILVYYFKQMMQNQWRSLFAFIHLCQLHGLSSSK